jgi:predicted RNA-binding protein YlxR (DUF448 family)
MRVVRTPDGAIQLDLTGRLAGRGAYLCQTSDCLEKAIAKGALSRALKTPLPADLREQLAAGMTMTFEGGTSGQE